MSTMREVGCEAGLAEARRRWETLPATLFHIGNLRPDQVEAAYLRFAGAVETGAFPRPDGYGSTLGHEEFAIGFDGGFDTIYRLISTFQGMKDYLTREGLRITMTAATLRFSDDPASQELSA